MAHPKTDSEVDFDRYARNYRDNLKDPIRDAFTGGSTFFHERKLDVIRQYFRQQSLDTQQLSWLDIGCGAGDLLGLGSEFFREATGCDPSLEMLRTAPFRHLSHQKSLRELPYADASFDFVTAVCVYHHVDPVDRGPLTHEVSRVLRNGGVFAIIEHNPFNPATQVIVRRCPVDVDARLLTSGTARRLTRAAGLTPAGTRYFLYFPEKLHRRMAQLEKAFGRIPAGGQYAVFSRKECQ